MFFSGKKKKELALILDIGSASVAGAFVELSLNEDPKILYVKRYPIKFIHDLESERFKKEMFKSLEQVSLDLARLDLSKFGKYSKKSIKKSYCSLASPWFVSQTKKTKFKKESEFVVTEKLIADFFKEEEKDFKNSNLSKYGSEKGTGLEVIERKLIDVRLNGYKVDNPLEKRAKEIDLNIFLSLSQTELLDGIEQAISKNFYIESFSFNSFTLASFSAVRDMYDRVSDFLLIDVTGEVTDVSLVRDGNVLKTISYPLGKNSLIRKISEEMKISPEEALSSIRLFITNVLDGKKLTEVKSVMEKLKKEWSGELQRALSSISNNFAVPKTVFFTSDEEVSLWYGEIIKSEEFVQYSMTEDSFIVSFINYGSLGSYVSFRSNMEKDTFIALESIFFNRVFELEE